VKIDKPKRYNIDLSMGRGGGEVEGRVYGREEVSKKGIVGLYGKDGFIIGTAKVKDGKYWLSGLFKGEYYLAFFVSEEDKVYWYKGVVEESRYNYPPSYISIPRQAVSFMLEKSCKIDINY
jgi:hypothetical protein